jgi:hypothetical protein
MNGEREQNRKGECQTPEKPMEIKHEFRVKEEQCGSVEGEDGESS